jgi:hypothetical protein
METFEEYTIPVKLVDEGLKRLGKMKLHKHVDPLNSHRFNMARGSNRKSTGQVPVSHQTKVSAPNITSQIANFVKGMEISHKIIDIAKKATSGVWRVSKSQVLDMAKKYKFNIPDADKPMKHLGSTGIMMIRYRPGLYYLYKPRRQKRHRRARTIKGASNHFKMGMGV